MDKLQFLVFVSVALFALGLLGVIVRRNLLVMLMCMELMLNGVLHGCEIINYRWLA